MSEILLWILETVGILALAFVAIILAVLVIGLMFAIGYSIYKGGKDGDGDV